MPDLEAAGRSLLDTNALKVYDDPRSPAGRHSTHPASPAWAHRRCPSRLRPDVLIFNTALTLVNIALTIC